jgi:hypothetical protein
MSEKKQLTKPNKQIKKTLPILETWEDFKEW